MQIYTGHTALWCILKGGTMEGRMIEESKKACLAHYKNLKKEKEKKKTSKILWLEVELVLVEAFQDKASDLMVFLQHFGIDEDVVKVHTQYTLCYEILEDVVHYGLEGGRAISESKEYNEWLKQFPVGPESSLPLISLLNAHIIVTPLDIQLSEVLHTLEVVNELGDEGERVTVLHCHGIEYLIVLNQSEGAILLFDEEDQRSH
ncbi:hypothetical protein C0989_004080 [Termitomyces sp. Mn162]|nr:hypothetical protein C0989_004080 [Termitomyces sp. Mn162]